jgi:hypothetical protein
VDHRGTEENKAVDGIGRSWAATSGPVDAIPRAGAAAARIDQQRSCGRSALGHFRTS